MFRRQGLPEEQLEYSGRDAGVDFSHWHPGVAHLQLWHQDPGHAPGTEAAEDAEAATVSAVPEDTKMLIKREDLILFTMGDKLNKTIFR